jgi:hypothetical protein
LHEAAGIMKHTKTVIALAGLAGIVATFLPYVSIPELTVTFWDVHNAPKLPSEGLLNGPSQVYIALACFALPLVMGLLAIATKQLARWQSIVALVFSLATFAVEGVRKGLLGEAGVSTAYGGKLLFIAAATAAIAALVGVIGPERRRI